jgi:hypothetical protein
MPKKTIRKGGYEFIPKTDNYSVFYPNLLLNPNISTQPNIDTSFKEVGILYKSKSVAKNVIKEIKSDFLNIVGKSPNSDNKYFNTPWSMAIEEITNDLKTYQELEPLKIFKIANLKFDFIAIDTNSLTLNIYGTLLCKDKENT